MSTAEETRTYTPEEYLALPDHDHYELVDGRLIEETMSFRANLVISEVSGLLWDFSRREGIGRVLPSETLYRCFTDPRKFRKADVSFIRRERLTAELLDDTYTAIAPDLAVEVISPNDLIYELGKKIQDYLAAGVRLVWAFDPNLRTATVYRANGTITILTERDELTGEDVIPGFRCAVAALFPDPPGGLIEENGGGAHEHGGRDADVHARGIPRAA